jgi:CO/xanthine dehydrogenase FAD-binding subunit
LKHDIFVPRTENELFSFLEDAGEHSKIVSGATDLLPRIRRRQEEAITLVDISRVDSLRYVKKEGGAVRIGALATLTDLISTPSLGVRYEAFHKLEQAFGSPPIRNLATVGGNLAASSSSEDLIPILLALDAEVTLKSRTSERAIQLVEFLRGKRQTSRRNNEILAEVRFNELNPTSWCTFEKVGRRERVIISLVSLACTLTIDRRSGKVEGAKIALNRIRGKIPGRAIETEKSIAGTALDESQLKKACDILESELALTNDFRASARYRTQVARNLLRECLIHSKHCIEEEA